MEGATACARTWESPRVGDSGAESSVQLEPLRDPPSPGGGGWLPSQSQGGARAARISAPRSPPLGRSQFVKKKEKRSVKRSRGCGFGARATVAT